MKLKCSSCESQEASPRLVGDEYLPFCSDCDWGVNDINDANEAGDKLAKFFKTLQELGMKFRPLYGRSTPKKKVHTN